MAVGRGRRSQYSTVEPPGGVGAGSTGVEVHCRLTSKLLLGSFVVGLLGPGGGLHSCLLLCKNDQ